MESAGKGPADRGQAAHGIFPGLGERTDDSERLTMNEQPESWKDLKWIEPESRFLMRSLFKRDLSVMTDSTRRRVNWTVLVLDALAIYILLQVL